jgi:hypothetical protein
MAWRKRTSRLRQQNQNLDLVVEHLLEGEVGEEVPAMIADLVVVHDEGIVEDSTY